MHWTEPNNFKLRRVVTKQHVPHASKEEINVFLIFASAYRANFNGNEETLRTVWSINGFQVYWRTWRKKMISSRL